MGLDLRSLREVWTELVVHPALVWLSGHPRAVEDRHESPPEPRTPDPGPSAA